MTKKQVALILVSSTAVLLFAGILLRPKLATYLAPEPQDYGGRMTSYMKANRFDDAVQVGREELGKRPDDSVVYGQIAIVYLVRAGRDAQLREKWLDEAVTNVDKALEANPRDPMNIIHSAQTLDLIGDLSASQRCAYYMRAVELAQRTSIMLEEDHITFGNRVYPIDPETRSFTVDGHTFEIATLQNNSRTVSEKAREKLTRNSCD
jgi:hypothetical protein